MGKTGVTLSDIAAQIGVSKVTVSYVLNGRHTRVRISDETRDRVLRTAQAMGYHPNALARGLARRRTDTLTLVMQSPAVFSGGSGFMNELMRGTLEAANERGFDLMLHTKSEPNIDRDALLLTDGRADGALLLRDLDDLLAPRLSERGFPFVQIFSRSLCPGAWFLDCDNVLGGRRATEHLLGLGHVRIAHLCGSPHSAAALDRREGYEQALAAQGIPANPAWCREVTYGGGDFDFLGGLLAGSDAPTALFAWSDDAAIGALRWLRERGGGKQAPRDISVVGYDGTDVCEQTSPRLTSVRQPIYDMAARGVELLVAQINKEPVAQTRVLFAPVLVPRASCGPPPA